jgi:oxalate decarboxylase/phosphoglucose isomerase-like protein (cupin superfamily)
MSYTLKQFNQILPKFSLEMKDSQRTVQKDWPSPFLIEFSKVGESAIGYISIAEFASSIPFSVKRTFWTYYTPESVVRGRHAHFLTEQVLIAVAGRIVVTTETAEGTIQTFALEKPNQGLYVPPNVWHTMMYNHNAVQLAFASTDYHKDDYIRDYESFRTLYR